MKQKKLYPRARWTKWRPHPSRGCFVAGCSLNNHPGREKKVVHIMQTVDTCMQYWREKIMKIRGQSLSSRFLRLIIPIPDCPPLLPMPSHSGQFGPCCPLLKEFSLTVNCCRVSLHSCTCRGGGHSGDVVFLQYTLYKYGNFPLEKYASEHNTSMQVCPSTQMHQEHEHVQKWTLKYAEEQSHWLARPSFCCLVTGRPSSS